jgi:polysaccharide chain length determinant protein (PEP-CTERM system associated)
VAERPAETTFDLERIKTIAWRRLPWLVTPLVIFMPFVLAAVAVLPLEYMASSRLMVREPEITNPLGVQQRRRISPQQRRINMEQRMLSSENLLGVVTELGLDREVLQDTALLSLIARIKQRIPMLHPAPMDQARLREQLMARLRRRINVRLLGEQLIEVNYQGIHSSLNARIVNTLVRGFIEDSLRSQRRGTQGRYTFLQETLDDYKKKLDESGTRLREFREKHLIDGSPDVDASTGALRNDVTALTEATIQHKLLEATLGSVEQEIERHQERITTETRTVPSPRTTALEQQIVGLQAELGRLTGTLTDINPRIVALRETISELEKELEQVSKETVTSEVTTATNPVYQSLIQQRNTLKPQIAAQSTRIQALERRVKIAQSRIQNVPAEEEERRKLDRDYTLYQGLYNQLSLQLASADINNELSKELANTETYEISERAEASTIPIGPDRLRLTAVGVVLCMGLGMAMTAGLEFLDQSFHNPTQVQSFLELPLLATIPPIMTSAEIRRGRLKKVLMLALLATVLTVEVLVGLVVTNLL